MSASNVLNLDEVVPGIAGTTLIYKGAKYQIRGDLPSETVFEFLALYDDLLKFRADAEKLAMSGDDVTARKMREDLQGVTEQIRAKLLEVFKLEHPDMEALPFGNKTTLIVLAEVLKAMGLGVQEVAGDENPPPPKRKKATTRTTTTSRSSKGTAQRRARKRIR